jgi:phage repressor protein C with HTH and peptisase S24 domain
MDWRDRIREAREAKGLGQKALGLLVGVSQTTIAKIESKHSQSTEVLEDLCRVLELDPATMPEEAFGRKRVQIAPVLYTDIRKEVAQALPEYARDPAYWASAAGLVGDVPLYASAEGGEGALLIERDPIGSVKRPPLLQGVKDGYAIYLVGESMMPEFEPGDTLFVNPRLPVLGNTTCVFYGGEDDEPKASVKRYMSATDEDWIVKQFNPPLDLKLPRKTWKVRHRIVAKNFR